MSVKIVHAADFHLDSAFGALSAEQARQRRRRENSPARTALSRATGIQQSARRKPGKWG